MKGGFSLAAIVVHGSENRIKILVISQASLCIFPEPCMAVIPYGLLCVMLLYAADILNDGVSYSGTGVMSIFILAAGRERILPKTARYFRII